MTTTQRKVKVGVVGCGVVATAYYLPYLMRHAELIAVCDLDPVRTAACVRLFGAREQYQDYGEMIRHADIEAVFVLTGPATHARFTLMAVEAGKHVLLQKPMATNMADAHAIVEAVRKTGVKCLVEPSSNSPLDPQYRHLRELVLRGVLGDIAAFTFHPGGMSQYHGSLGGNPYGEGAFFSADSGGMVFDFPYAPSQIVSVLGGCKSISARAKICLPERDIVPEHEYTRFLENATDPDEVNYWDVVLNLPRSQHIVAGAPDNAVSVMEMSEGAIGTCYIGRLFQPVPKGFSDGGFKVYGVDGNLIMGMGHFASILTSKRELLPLDEAHAHAYIDPEGWYHMSVLGDLAKAHWPKPVPGGFNYYHQSTQHLIDCICEDRDPIVNVAWGRHITEIMYGTLESARTGQRYVMTTSPVGMV